MPRPEQIERPERILELVLKGLKYERLVSSGLGMSQIVVSNNNNNNQEEEEHKAKEQRDKAISKLKQHKVFEEVVIDSMSFSRDGNLLAVGTHDGFIEFWNPLTFTQAPEGILGFDQSENPIVHDTAVLALCFGHRKYQNVLCSGD